MPDTRAVTLWTRRDQGRAILELKSMGTTGRMASRTAGYSGTPLARKLGIGVGGCVLAFDPPGDYLQLLAPIPEGVTVATRLSQKVDLVHVFVDKRTVLESRLRQLRSRMRPDTAVWVSWPKKASKVPTDVTEDTIRAVALPLGFVDVKVCAVSDVWSGLKIVIRKELR